MYVCLCNALTDRKLKEAIQGTDSQCAADVYAACGCRAKCGKCVQMVKDMLQDCGRGGESTIQTA